MNTADRNDRILKFLVNGYIVTLDQVALLFYRQAWRTLGDFRMFRKTAYNDLLGLSSDGIIGRDTRETRQLGKQHCCFLTTKGLRKAGYNEKEGYGHYFRAARRLSKYGSQNTAHSITVAQVYTDLRLLSCWLPPLNLCYWRFSRDLGNAFAIKQLSLAGCSHDRVILRPDAVGTLLFDEKPYRFLLEVDMGTMSSRKLEHKFAEYKEAYERGYFQQYWGHKEMPVVLFITTSRRS
jgi:hypothetical protein